MLVLLSSSSSLLSSLKLLSPFRFLFPFADPNQVRGTFAVLNHLLCHHSRSNHLFAVIINGVGGVVPENSYHSLPYYIPLQLLSLLYEPALYRNCRVDVSFIYSQDLLLPPYIPSSYDMANLPSRCAIKSV